MNHMRNLLEKFLYKETLFFPLYYFKKVINFLPSSLSNTITFSLYLVVDLETIPVTPPPVLAAVSDEDLLAHNFRLPDIPCHTQDTERIIQLVKIIFLKSFMFILLLA